ncbi:MAG: TldD/PmbA family protein [Acidobacteriia bacterium]|nr:TldD/PmbA family protein [Terriglobia bacterium]
MQAGAVTAEVLIHEGREFSTVVRLGAVEKLVQAGSRRLGMRIFQGTRCAISSTSDFSAASLHQMVCDTCDMARAAGEDPAAGIPEQDLYARDVPQLHLFFPAADGLPADQKIAWARTCEQAALQCDPRINNSEGAGFSDSVATVTYANSAGVCASYDRSVCTLYAAPLAESDGQKQRDYWLTTHPDLKRLQPPQEVGAEAARRVLRRLGARRVSTCSVPVVFDPLTAAALLRHLADAVSGTALVRKTSFLAGKLGARVASPLVTICDDALLPGGLGSRPFDAEGVPSQTTSVVRAGVLESFLLDSYTARKLGLRSTANSNRPLHGAPAAGPSNFFLEAGTATPDEIIATVKNGLYVTDLIGFGVNLVSGNFSQGAAGIWIDGGRLAFPVEEITVAGNLKDMLTSVEAVGNDLLALGEIFAPTLLIGKMVVSGS